MPVGSTARRPVHVSGFTETRLLTPPHCLISASCSSGQRFASSFLQIRSHPRHPCLRLTLPHAGCVKDLHLQVSAPCRAHEVTEGNRERFPSVRRAARPEPSGESRPYPLCARRNERTWRTAMGIGSMDPSRGSAPAPIFSERRFLSTVGSLSRYLGRRPASLTTLDKVSICVRRISSNSDGVLGAEK